MASSEILDFAALLTPVPGDNPAGIDFRSDDVTSSPSFFDSDYYKIKAVRTQARRAERQYVGDEENESPPQADWRPILEMAPKIIAEQSKDLQVAVWLLEALVRRHGYAGLRDGFRMIREMLQTYWDSFYPLPDPDGGGVADRLAPLTGLNGQETEGALIGPIRRIPLTEEGSTDPLSYVDYQQAADLETLDDPTARSRRLEQGAVSREILERAVRNSAKLFLRNLLDDIKQAIEEHEKLCQFLDTKCGDDAPLASNIRNVLADCHEAFVILTRDILKTAAEEADALVPTGPGGAAADGRAVPGSIQTREDAFRWLSQVADFFQAAEPHSPVSYLLRQAVRWGRMPLPELWQELIPEEAVRKNVFKIVGIQPSGDEDHK